MRIQLINNYHNQLSHRAGLYFTRKPKVLFDHCSGTRYIAKDIVKISKDGFGYVEDIKIPQDIKDRFANANFIKALAEKFDTFVCYREFQKGHKNNLGGCEDMAYARVMWKDGKEAELGEKTDLYGAKYIEVLGYSEKSQESATNKMFKNLEDGKFC